MIERIVFDLGNVLFPLDYEELHTWLHTTHSQAPVQFREKFDQLYVDYEAGAFDTESFFHQLRQDLGMSFEEETFKKKWLSLWKRDNEDVHTLLRELEGKQDLSILSNTNEIHMTDYLKTKPILSVFNRFFFSHEMHMAKPNRRIYEKVQIELGVQADEILFFDDRVDNIEAAKKVGWNAHVFVDGAGVRRVLEEYALI